MLNFLGQCAEVDINDMCTYLFLIVVFDLGTGVHECCLVGERQAS